MKKLLIFFIALALLFGTVEMAKGMAEPTSVVVPEPGILILLGIALSAIGLAARRYKL